jgi:cation:H+ antiporter
VWRLAALGLVILSAGWLVARIGDDFTRTGPFSGTFIGAALVALTTSLPELSTVLGSLRSGNYDMAVSNIVGTNGLEVALLLVADASFREGPILASVAASDTFLAALGATLTGIYLGSLLLRREGTVLRVGYGSAAVIVLYLAGMGVLAGMG